MRRGLGGIGLIVALAAGLPGLLPAQGGGAPERRQRMEAQLRQGLWRIAKERVGLSDDQMRRLEQSTPAFDARRRALIAEDRAQRQVLRRELAAGDAANQDRVAAALDRLLTVQRQRVELNADEQKSLAGFMTPVQRARYAALQEQLRRRADALRRARQEGKRPTTPP